MKKKGFTLVELLAVIVILAIIALITIPLVIKTINNSEIEGEKKSIEGYVRAEENYIQNDMMQHPGRNYSYYKDKMPFADLEYKGNTIICEYETLYDNDKIKLTDCYVTKKTREEIDDIQKEGQGKNHYNYENGKVILIENSNQSSGESDTESVTKTAVQELLSKTNPESVTVYEQGSDASHQMYTFSHPATEQTEALTDYRYIGNDPYNYVEFNNEIWRIVGIFTVEDDKGNTSQRIKLISNHSVRVMNWDSNRQNDWTKSTLNEYLNGEYYDSLSDGSKILIDNAKYYLGGFDSAVSSQMGTSDFYNYERSNSVYRNNSKNWIGKIGLMYRSDYGYTYAYGVNDTSYFDTGRWSNQGWLYVFSDDWIITTRFNNQLDSNEEVFGVFRWGSVLDGSGTEPVLYLKSSVQIASGTGTSSNPYKLKI